MTRTRPLTFAALLGLALICPSLAGDEPQDTSVLRHTVVTIQGKKQPLKKLRGKALLIVNTASRCGYTRQYAGLQKLHERYGEKGLVVMAFPCNQFGGQEPGSAEQIQAFCSSKFQVKFPLYAKVEVLPGEGQAPLFKSLTTEGPKETRGKIKWNFEKFLINAEGELVGRWRSGTEPTDPKLMKAIEAALPAAKD